MSNSIGANVLITGSNRGIGFGLIKQLLKESDVKRIFAGCRNPDKASDLKSLQEKHESIKIVQLDVQCDKSINNAFEKISSELGGDDAKLNLLINNAGILESEGVSIQKPNREVYLRHFNINSVSPVIMTSKFLPLLNNAAKVNETARVVNISSSLGSCTHTNGTKMIPHSNAVYGMSKAALNSYTRCLMGDERNIVSIALCPGWVKTDMGGPNAHLTLDESTVAIVDLIKKLKKDDSGKFLNKSGSIPF